MADFYPIQESLQQSLNGSVERDIHGEAVILTPLGSQPIQQKSLSLTTDTSTPPAAVGATYEGGTVLNVSSARIPFLVDDTVKELWRHDLDILIQ